MIRLDGAQYSGVTLTAKSFGVLGSEIPTSGTNGASVLAQYVVTTPDQSSLFRIVVTAWPLVGTLTMFEDGSFIYDAPEGTSDSFTYSAYKDEALIATDTETLIINEAVNGNTAPVVNAGPDQSVPAGAFVTLDGSGSSDADLDTLTYLWSQTDGDTVTLSSTTAVQPTFTAPTTGAAQTLTFSLVVNDGTDSSTADTVDIVVDAEIIAGESSGGVSLLQMMHMW